MHAAHSPPLLPVCRERGENGGREKVGRGILSLSMQEKHKKYEEIEEGDLELVHHTHRKIHTHTHAEKYTHTHAHTQRTHSHVFVYTHTCIHDAHNTCTHLHT